MNRRDFLRDTTAVTAALATTSAPGLANVTSRAEDEPSEKNVFVSQWANAPDRVWLGPEYWANPLQDWRLEGGRIVCVTPALNRNVHLLTRELGAADGTLSMSVQVGRADGETIGQGRGSFGFRIGVRGPLREYCNSLIFGNGLDAGLTASGALFVGNLDSAEQGTVPMKGPAIELRLKAEPIENSYTVTLSAHDPESDKAIAEVRRAGIAGDRLTGNLSLVANFPGTGPASAQAQAKAQTKTARQGAGTGSFWFADWKVSGSKVEVHDDRVFGPILFSQYTLTDKILGLSAQMPPIGENDAQTVRLQVQEGDAWKTIAEEPIHPTARLATFRVENWDTTKDVPYRLAYAFGNSGDHYWIGTVQRDPVDKSVITLADISCNIHSAFPNQGYVERMAQLDPDLLAFVGDQFYESSGGYGTTRAPLDTAILDYLRKWYLHGWTWRDLTRDRPSISIPDDHDVWQGNIWGESGAPQLGTQEAGGYEMFPDWVNVVHQTQTAHHPTPYDPSPVHQGITAYFGPLTYGRISFAILADRQFKNGPEGKVPPTGGRGDHVTDPDFDPKSADLPGLELLGDRQMDFLQEWVADWRGADLKGVISQTIFTAMATTHGRERMRLRADYDTNGWPQTPRNETLRVIRKALAVHIAGDQHLPALIHYGIDTHQDAAVAFAGPAVNVGYPRWWEPEVEGKNREPGAPEHTGDYIDHFGHPITVYAVANGAVEPRGDVLEQLEQKTSGIGLVHFDKPNRQITFECWPFLADVTRADTQFPGWPRTFDQRDNDGRKPVGQLPKLEVEGVENPVVQVFKEPEGELVYALRVAGTRFQPQVYESGTYTVSIGEPESGRVEELKNLKAAKNVNEAIQVKF